MLHGLDGRRSRGGFQGSGRIARLSMIPAGRTRKCLELSMTPDLVGSALISSWGWMGLVLKVNSIFG